MVVSYIALFFKIDSIKFFIEINVTTETRATEDLEPSRASLNVEPHSMEHRNESANQIDIFEMDKFPIGNQYEE